MLGGGRRRPGAQSRGKVLVAVRQAGLFTDRLEFSQRRLAQFALEVRVACAAEDPTAREAVLVNRAPTVLLIRTPTGGHLSKCIGPQPGGQVDQLRRRDEEPVVVGREIAAGAAGVASSRSTVRPLDLRVDPAIELRHLLDHSAVSVGFSHHRLFFRIRSISSHVYRRPRLIPGHRIAARFQASGFCRFSDQNGHVRHWLGRTV